MCRNMTTQYVQNDGPPTSSSTPPTFLMFIFAVVHFVVPMWFFFYWGSLPQGKPAATDLRYPILINHKMHPGSFHVSKIHRTLTWILNTHIYVIIVMRTYTHGGLGTPTASQHNIFDSEKLSQIFLCSWRSLDLGSDVPQTDPPCHPMVLYLVIYNDSEYI